MSYPIKTTVSNIRDLYDLNGLWLPKGNYYFEISNIFYLLLLLLRQL